MKSHVIEHNILELMLDRPEIKVAYAITRRHINNHSNVYTHAYSLYWYTNNEYPIHKHRVYGYSINMATAARDKVTKQCVPYISGKK